jgi:hypothetical protein
VLLPKFLILSISSNYPILSIGLAQEDSSLSHACSKKLSGGSFNHAYSPLWEHPQRCSVCEPAKLFLTSEFRYSLFSNPTHKTKTKTAIRWETISIKPPEPREEAPPLPIRNREQHVIFITLFSSKCQALKFAAPFHQPQQTVQECWAECILLSQTSIF